MAEYISPNTIRNYFNFKPTSRGQIKEGMLLSFGYRSPDRKIHDPKPLIYVLERKGDKVYGLNVHYDFNLIGGAIALKRQELEEKTNYLDPNKEREGWGGPVESPKVVGGGKKSLNEDEYVVGGGKTPKDPRRWVVGGGEKKSDVVGGPAAGKSKLGGPSKKPDKLGGGQKTPKLKPGEKPAKPPSIIVPPTLLETYNLTVDPTSKTLSRILRSYLYKRMSGISKLILKI